MFLNENQITSSLVPALKNKNNKSKIEETKLKNSFISTDSTNEQEINNKIFKYILKNDKKAYHIFLILFKEKLKIKVKPILDKNEYFYEIEFTQKELNDMNKIFKLCNKIEESFGYLNELFKEEQNQFTIYESNDLIKIEKKLQFSVPLKIEIPKLFITRKNCIDYYG